MRKLYLLALIPALIFTSCSKDKDTPEPAPVVTPTPTPTVVVKSFNYLRGSGFTDLHLEVRDASNNVIFNNNVYSTVPSTVTFSINEDETYNYYIIANGNTFYEDGTFGYSSTSGMWNTAINPPTQVTFQLSSNDVYIWKP